MKEIEEKLIIEVENLIVETKDNIVVNVATEATLLYWNVGKLINTILLENKRADYGKSIIDNLSTNLLIKQGKLWNNKMLWNCSKFNTIFPDESILYALSRQLSWTHFRKLIYIEDELKREFYIEMCKLEKWSTRMLEDRIKSMLYERTAISKKPNQTIKNDLELLKNEQKMNADLVFKDPYLLDFLDLKDTYSEKDLETAILADLQRFLIELGNDFAFLARQKRVTIDHTDYYIDLLFYHRRLKSLIVIDLKLGDFEASYKGQMELYLRYLEKYEKVEGENSPIGLILCSGKNEEHIELLELEKSNIKVAEYLTILPPMQLLKEKLHKAILYAKERSKNT